MQAEILQQPRKKRRNPNLVDWSAIAESVWVSEELRLTPDAARLRYLRGCEIVTPHHTAELNRIIEASARKAEMLRENEAAVKKAEKIPPADLITRRKTRSNNG